MIGAEKYENTDCDTKSSIVDVQIIMYPWSLMLKNITSSKRVWHQLIEAIVLEIYNVDKVETLTEI